MLFSSPSGSLQGSFSAVKPTHGAMKPLLLTELSDPSLHVPGAAGAVTGPRWLPRLSLLGWSVVLGLLALIVWDGLGLDLAAVRAFGDLRGFAWRNHWLTSGVMHQGGRWLATGLVVLLLVNAARPRWPGLTRRERWTAVAITAVCLILIPLIKQGSTTSCPWDLAEFGGTARYVSHWRFGVADGGPGHCFPSGHASSAFAFFSLFFMLRRVYPRQAGVVLLGVMVLGFCYGMAQMARGAHYPSHTLWTAWICWTVTVGMTRISQGQWRIRRAAPTGQVA